MARTLFAECRICVSGFELDDKDRLRQTIERHGGVYERSLARDETTHLLATTAEGAKYDAALLWHIPVLAEGWIDACIDANGAYPARSLARSHGSLPFPSSGAD